MRYQKGTETQGGTKVGDDVLNMQHGTGTDRQCDDQASKTFQVTFRVPWTRKLAMAMMCHGSTQICTRCPLKDPTRLDMR